ncbi:hypothetical protein H072_6721 [Dactylellina haptotyla CBS 200.50]|uniref:Uncharacterized protein n=1 Tax=Dactylellina haptotyla (strain CBS 200.50) TaxID=1284197 RepID=S8A999_DACHA|nr:hypothetical protein H072_6721 [Dactylellina haptotyla CBS 200.50]
MFGRRVEEKRFSSINAIVSSIRRLAIRPKSTQRTPVPRELVIPLLPTEILETIFFHFWESDPPTGKVQNFRLACRLFNEIAVLYIYRDLKLRLNDFELQPWSQLLSDRNNGLKYASGVSISGFVEGYSERGYYGRKKPPKYTQRTRDFSRAAVTELLEKLEPGRLKTFSIAGRHMTPRLAKISTRLLFDKQPNLRHLCIPLPLLLRHGDNVLDALTVIPRFQSLYLTDVKYTRHIADIWALLQNSSDSLVSLAIRSPLRGHNENQLQYYLEWNQRFRPDRVGLARTELRLSKLRDLFIEGIPNLDRLFDDCAPNLIPFASLRMLRIEKCTYVDAFMLRYCNKIRMPNLKSLQILEKFSTVTFDAAIMALAPLETLVVCGDFWGSQPDWTLIKTHHAKTLKRLWVDHKYQGAWTGISNLFNMQNQQAPYTDCFFPNGWPQLEEVAVDLADGKDMILPESVKACRLLGFNSYATPYSVEHGSYTNRIISFGVPVGQGSNLVLGALGRLDPPATSTIPRFPYIYKVDRKNLHKASDKSEAKAIMTSDVKKLMPDSHIMFYERMDHPWSDNQGSLWY